MKIHIITLILFIFFSTFNLIGQTTTFEYLLSTPLDERFADIIQTQDDTIYFNGVLSDMYHPNHKYGLIVKMDKYGTLVDSIHIYNSERSNTFYNIFYNNDNEFILVGNVFDIDGSYKNAGIILNRMDRSLYLSDQNIYYFPVSYKLFHMAANLQPEGNIIVGGGVDLQNYIYQPYFYEFNNNFDSVKAKHFVDEIGIFSHLNFLSGGNYWVLDQTYGRYKLLDSLLNIISEQEVPDNLGPNFGVVWDTDTSFILLGDDGSHNLGFIKQFYPLDTTGYIYNHWNISDTVDFPALWNGIDFKDKDSVFIGGTRNFGLGYYTPWPSWFIVLQTDSLLNIRWERFYGGDAYYMMGKLIATNDGGCLVAGTRYDYLNTTDLETDIIILKLNSEGLITSNPGKPSVEMHEAIIYPNPGTNVINVRIAVQYKQSVFELFDINGRHILKENFVGTLGTVNTTFLEHGTYIYRITSDDGLLETGKWVKR